MKEMDMPSNKDTRTAKLYRMATPDHTCPYGLKSKDLLERQGLEVVDHPLETREQTDAFMEKHGVETTPQTFVEGERVGGYEDLRIYFDLDKPKEEQSDTSYQPVIAIFAVAGLMALGLSWYSFENIFTLRAFEWFISISMCFLALQKLQDVESFSTMFLNYDLLAQRWVSYGKVYPFGEAFAGIAMTAGALLWLAAPVAIIIGGIGAVSVIKAVYIDKRELKCACVGGSSNVPLGFISLTENLMMLGMGGWMLARML
jgi:glutaredoxin